MSETSETSKQQREKLISEICSDYLGSLSFNHARPDDEGAHHGSSSNEDKSSSSDDDDMGEGEESEEEEEGSASESEEEEHKRDQGLEDDADDYGQDIGDE